MGMPPARSVSTLAASLSMQITSWPNSDRQAPDTKPTYPVPMMAMRMESPTDYAFLGLDGFQLQAGCRASLRIGPRKNRAAGYRVRPARREIAIERDDALCGDTAPQQCINNRFFADIRRYDDGRWIGIGE